MPYPKEDRTPARNNPMMMNKTISIYPSIISITTAPVAHTAPIKAVAIITLPVIPFKPMTSSCSSSSSAGNENTAMPSNTSRK